MKRISIDSLKNDRGSIMLVVLLILSLVTVLGMASSKTTFIEMQISSNQEIYKDNFFQADGAINEGTQVFANIGDDMANTPPAWMQQQTTLLLPPVTDSASQANEAAAVVNDAIWNQDANTDGVLDNTYSSVAFPGAQVMSVHRGIAPGSSLDVGSARLHIFEFYSRSQLNNGNVILKAGYRQPF